MSNKNLKGFLKSSLLLIALLGSIVVHAQNTTVSGKVLGATGEELLGVNVFVKGTRIGTTTDIEGNYSLNISSQDAILVFSYVGFSTQELAVNGQTNINVTLEEDLSFLDQVVVVGYGTAKKSDLTGSVVSVKSEELNAFPVLNAEQALQGRAAGVSVQSNNGGEPGTPISVRVRGNTSIGAGSGALVVVDGFVGATYPQQADIESVEILKDASATAIYGSQGANGVILVTTKKGRIGKVSVELNSTYSAQSTSEQLDLLNADQFGDYQTAISPNYLRGPADTDWQDLIYQSGYTQNHNLSFSGATEEVNYYVSANYFDQEGVVINSGFDRFSILGKVDAQVTDKLKLGVNIFTSRGNKEGVSTQASTGGTGSGDVISIAYRFAPDLGIVDEDGVFTFNSVGDDVDNPFAIATLSIDETKTDNSRINTYADYSLTDNLSVKSVFGFSTRNETRGTYQPSSLTIAGANGGSASILSGKRTSLLSETYVTYKKEFEKSNIEVVGGYSYQRTINERSTTGAEQFLSDSFGYRNLSAGAIQLIPTSDFSESIIQSQLGRFNYRYDDRYLLTFTARRDGSSNFARNEKYAFFPSAALGWNVSNEDFLKESSTISNLKLRASYGATGTQSINPYQSLASYTDIYAVVGGQTVNAIVPFQVANPDLKWETSYQTNIGLDLGLLNNRFSVVLDYYNIDTEDLILNDSSVPEIAGQQRNDLLKNVGEINNKGFEVSLTSRNIVTDDFAWTTDFNYSRNQNEVVSLVDGSDIFFDASPGHFLQDETHVLRVGEAVGVFYGYEYRGVNQGVAPEGTAIFATAAPAAGQELFTDVNGDGIINTNDRKIIGDPNQKWTAGLNNTFRYKDFDLNVFFQGAFGGDIFSFTALELASGNSNATTEALDAWTPTNTDTNVPIAAVRNRRITSRFVYDGSYVRLKNLALGYNIPKDVVEKIGFERIRLGISGQNLLTFTDYPGTDPEVSYKAAGNLESNVNQGFDYGNYPNIKSVSFNVNLKF